jgi:hypothetical protein
MSAGTLAEAREAGACGIAPIYVLIIRNVKG